MELIAKVEYHNPFCTLFVGQSTAEFEIPAEVKAQMLADHPDLFEVVGNRPTAKEQAEVQTPEDGLQIENQEAKLPKTRKK